MKLPKIPTFAGLLILIVGLATGVLLINITMDLRLNAALNKAPEDLIISNITDKSITVSWHTEAKTRSSLRLREKAGVNYTIHTGTQSGQSFTHYFNIENLKESTEYQIAVISDGLIFDNGQTPWIIKTAKKSLYPTTPHIISGKVVDQTQNPIENALVYAYLADSLPLSTVTNNEGEWIISLASVISKITLAPLPFDDSYTVEVFVETGNQGRAIAKISVGSARPSPDISIGKTHDFTQVVPIERNVDDADLKLPISQLQNPTDEITITLPAEGQALSQTNFLLTGSGPANKTIMVIVESDPQLNEVVISNNGTWQVNLDKQLEAGEHKVTVQWQDDDGITQKLERSFIVSAKEINSFDASQTSLLVSPTAILNLTPPAGSNPLPEAGTLTPTMLLLTMSIAFLFGGSLTYLTHNKS